MRRLLAAILLTCGLGYGQRLVPGFGGSGTGGGGGTPGGSTTQLQYNNAGALGGISGATTNGTVVTLTSPVFVTPALGTPASGTLTNTTGFPFTALSVPPWVINAKTATYQTTILDFAQCKTIPIASGTFTVTLVDTASQPPDGNCIRILNYGSGVITVARSGQNINGGTASLTLAAGSAAAPSGVLVTSNGTNYFAQPFGATVCATCVTTNNSATFGANTYDFSAATVALDSTHVITTTAYTMSAGATINVTPSATLYGIKIVGGQPSSLNGGGLYMTASGRFGWDDGANIHHAVGVVGSGVTPPTAPSAGVGHFPGASFDLSSSLIVAADITAATITAAKLAATTWDAQTDASTITWAIASVLNAQATVTLGGNRTLNISNPVVGGNYVFRITQDGTGTRTLTKGSGCTWKELGSSAATFGLSTAVNAIDVLTFTYDGTNCLASVGKAYGG